MLILLHHVLNLLLIDPIILLYLHDELADLVVQFFELLLECLLVVKDLLVD